MAAQSFQLIMRKGPIPGKIFDLGNNEFTVGRDISNDIVISDVEVSRKHARLVLQADGYVLEDMGSTNGSFVNGQRLMGPKLLRVGDTIMFGENVSLIFEGIVDADATVVSTPAPAQTPVTEFSPPRQAGDQSSPQVYAGQIPESPADISYENFASEEKPASKTWIWIGCGCLALLCIVVVAGAFVFDAMNLYCTPPFNVLFACP